MISLVVEPKSEEEKVVEVYDKNNFNELTASDALLKQAYADADDAGLSAAQKKFEAIGECNTILIDFTYK